MSTEPQYRASLDGPSGGLVTQFDLHLRIIADRYLGFFLERRRIEEVYIDSLWRLHHKAKAIDSFFDSRTEPSTTRVAWNEIRDNVERETQARQAFLNTLTSDIINPLTVLKESQDRTRKRIKEDLKGSALAHADYAENTLPKLKRAYLKKCQEFEDHRLASASSPSAVGQFPSAPEGSTVPSSRSNPNLPSKSYIASPQPLRPLDRKPSGGAPRNRSPSTSTAFSDLAQHGDDIGVNRIHTQTDFPLTGKKQLNQLITLLDKEGGIRGSNRNADNALRSVRAKREAEDADKDYRRAVHWLETLRIRRVKILEGGYNSLERFVFEGTDIVKKVLVTYADTMIATYTTQNYLATHARSAVEKVSAETDTSILAASLHRSFTLSIPPPTLYYNYHVGECQDLIFGVTLVDYATARSSENDVPKTLRICIDEIDKRGLDAEGIYRVSGRHANVQELQHKLERSERAFSFNSYTDDIYSVASFLKELPEPLFRFPLQDRIQHSEDMADHAANDFVLLRSKIRRLPPVHRTSLKALVEHLSRVASHADKNKMDPKNLAIVFSPVVFGEDEIPQGDLLSVQPTKDSVMENLIENAYTLFDERLPPSSPPLPPAPGGEPVPATSYGSSHTKVTLPQSGEVEVADFTPELPPRPTSSIHPSARSNPPMSPSRLSIDLSASLASTPSPPPPALPARVQIPTDGTEQPTQGQITDLSAVEAVERAPNQYRVSIFPPLASAPELQQQQSTAESIPETPLTTSTRTSRSYECLDIPLRQVD
ncbi:hypothetical protein B0F90DRAFT_1674209 [Multifurca ochricompacta]|uniref:Rho-GAP domain-containing protein n=1 Tax=Multifurca ochricompacta TaxID=376703 RepID=A0AAD4MCF3_9AGAM|nr:hypothetical protein B0F90DRAFT_1674209 [Multifurca ochricompacta]